MARYEVARASTEVVSAEPSAGRNTDTSSSGTVHSTTAMQAMTPTPIDTAVQPARVTPARSAAPAASATRIPAAFAMPIGSMKVNEAICSANWCAASSWTPMRPITKAEPANSAISNSSASPIGVPSRSTSKKRFQSARQKRPSTWKRRKRRSTSTKPSSSDTMTNCARLEPMPAPSTPSAGNPRWP